MKTLAPLVGLLVVVASSRGADEPVEALIKQLRSGDDLVRLTAAVELGKVGKPAAPPVAALLADPDADVRFYATWALAFLGPDAKDQTAAVIKLLGDDNAQVRRKAAFALGRIASLEDALPLLLKTFADEDEAVRDAAAASVQRFGAAAHPALMRVLGDDRPLVRHVAFKTLVADRVDPFLEAQKTFDRDNALYHVRVSSLYLSQYASTVTAINVLGEALKDKSRTVRFEAAVGLARVGLARDNSVAILVEALKDKDVETRRAAANGLSQVGQDAKPALDALKAAAADPDATVRTYAQRAVERLEKK